MSFKRGPGMAMLRANLLGAREVGIKQLHTSFVERLSHEGNGKPSLIDEYPNKQSGDFIRDLKITDDGVANTSEYGEALEFKPPSEGGRRPFGTAAEDETLHAEVVQAVVDDLRGSYG